MESGPSDQTLPLPLKPTPDNHIQPIEPFKLTLGRRADCLRCTSAAAAISSASALRISGRCVNVCAGIASIWYLFCMSVMSKLCFVNLSRKVGSAISVSATSSFTIASQLACCALSCCAVSRTLASAKYCDAGAAKPALMDMAVMRAVSLRDVKSLAKIAACALQKRKLR